MEGKGMTKRKLWAILCVGLFLALAACSKKGLSTTVDVVANEWSLKPSVTSVKAGETTFVMKNDGTVPHELVVLKTELPPSGLRMRANDPTRADEDTDADNVGEVENSAIGSIVSVTLNLVPGNYVLVCNLEAHYTNGMFAAFKVK
jgi:uncharacterized cupredoxin-like copper-binding protein